MNIEKKQTLIILDWDDTLFPTTWVTSNRINLNNNIEKIKNQKYFKQLDDELSSFLITLKKYGEIIIVTNAMPEWIQLSSVVLPKTSVILKDIKIFSARKMFQEKYPSNSMKWKELTFKEVLKQKYENKSFANIISIGDAEYEYNALINLINHEYNTAKILKSVKFIKNPSRNMLIEQLSTLKIAFPSISKKPTHLDLIVELCGSA